jgi:hypothetical protein
MFPKQYPTDKEIALLKPKHKPYRISMGRSLFLSVQISGRIYWHVKSRFGGKETVFSLGSYPIISISEARRINDEIKEMAKNGINTATIVREEKRETKEEIKRKKLETTFKLDLAMDGGLVIARHNKTLSLTPQQTKVLKYFLNTLSQEKNNE